MSLEAIASSLDAIDESLMMVLNCLEEQNYKISELISVIKVENKKE